MKYSILTLFSLLILNSCKNSNTKTKALSDGIVVLNPDLNEVKKKYIKYSTFNPFDSDENLYSIIEPSKNEKGKAKILISESDQFNYQIFNEYVKKNMKGVYESYLVRKNKIVFRDFHRFYKYNDSIKIKNLKDFENYFNQNKIGFKLHKNKYFKDENGTKYIFFLKKITMKDSIYFSAFLTQEKIETHIFYNLKDTIDALPWNSMDPYKGKIIEN